MQIIEQFSRSKYGDESLNEDSVVVTGDFAAVIDGATDNSGAKIDGDRPGRFASRVVAAAFETLDKHADAHDAAAHLNAALKEARAQSGVPDGVKPFCVFAAYSKARREIFCVGDVQVTINGADHTRDIDYVDALVTARQALLHSHLAGGASIENLLADDPATVLYDAMANNVFSLLNESVTQYGFGAIDGGMTPDALIRAIPVPDGAEIILASDGYPVVEATLEDSERHLAEILKADPLLIGDHPQPRCVVPGGISYDDRSWLRFTA